MTHDPVPEPTCPRTSPAALAHDPCWTRPGPRSVPHPSEPEPPAPQHPANHETSRLRPEGASPADSSGTDPHQHAREARYFRAILRGLLLRLSEASGDEVFDALHHLCARFVHLWQPSVGAQEERDILVRHATAEAWEVLIHPEYTPEFKVTAIERALSRCHLDDTPCRALASHRLLTLPAVPVTPLAATVAA